MNYYSINNIQQLKITEEYPYRASMNLQAAVNATELPEEIIMHLALSGAIRSDLPRANPSFLADDIFKIGEAIERHKCEGSIYNEALNQTNN